jgi:hypothetical protein
MFRRDAAAGRKRVSRATRPAMRETPGVTRRRAHCMIAA